MRKQVSPRGFARRGGGSGAGPVYPSGGSGFSVDRTNRARSGRRRPGSVREQPGQRASGYIAAARGPVCGPLARAPGGGGRGGGGGGGAAPREAPRDPPAPASPPCFPEVAQTDGVAEPGASMVNSPWGLSHTPRESLVFLTFWRLADER